MTPHRVTKTTWPLSIPYEYNMEHPKVTKTAWPLSRSYECKMVDLRSQRQDGPSQGHKVTAKEIIRCNSFSYLVNEVLQTFAVKMRLKEYM